MPTFTESNFVNIDTSYLLIGSRALRSYVNDVLVFLLPYTRHYASEAISILNLLYNIMFKASSIYQ